MSLYTTLRPYKNPTLSESAYKFASSMRSLKIKHLEVAKLRHFSGFGLVYKGMPLTLSHTISQARSAQPWRGLRSSADRTFKSSGCPSVASAGPSSFPLYVVSCGADHGRPRARTFTCLAYWRPQSRSSVCPDSPASSCTPASSPPYTTALPSPRQCLAVSSRPSDLSFVAASP
jgi:hypothetical protein